MAIPTDAFNERAGTDPVVVFEHTHHGRKTTQQTLYRLLSQHHQRMPRS